MAPGFRRDCVGVEGRSFSSRADATEIVLVERSSTKPGCGRNYGARKPARLKEFRDVLFDMNPPTTPEPLHGYRATTYPNNSWRMNPYVFL